MFYIYIQIIKFQSMQTQRTRKSARKIKINSRERQNRAIVNLSQLSDTQWYGNTNQPVNPNHSSNLSKTKNNTNESQELPLDSKLLNQQLNFRYTNRHFLSISNSHQNTIHNHNLQKPSSKKSTKQKSQPFTSINFYQSINNSYYNSINDRSRQNQERKFFNTKIKDSQGQTKQSQNKKSKNSGINQAINKLTIKKDSLKTSLFYKKMKELLSQSFKVDGKPVQIKWDRFSIETHGLPKKKSIYTFKDQTSIDAPIMTKVGQFLKKVHRYELDWKQKEKNLINFQRKKSITYTNTSSGNRTFHAQTIDIEGKKKNKGKLWLGRPPAKVFIQQDEQQKRQNSNG